VPWRRQFPSDSDAPAAARAALEDLRPLLDPVVLGRLRLVTSELVTNAVRHGPGSPITLHVEVLDRDRVRGEVVDDGGPGSLPHPVAPRGPDGGYGLHVVDGLAQRWGVYEGSTHVWFELAA
jgi:anti-sigma regulatory factor (Ser/Thr protein kinase)